MQSHTDIASIGIMAFGVEDPRPLAIATGVIVGFFGGLMIAVNFKVPPPPLSLNTFFRI